MVGSNSQADGAPRLRVDGVRIDFEATRSSPAICAVRDVSFDVGVGEIVSIVGPSGCGKSTLLSAIAGLLSFGAGRVTSGKISLDGVDLKKPNPKQAVVFQTPALLPWKNAAENVAYPLTLSGVPKRAALEKALEALDRVGLAQFARVHPQRLSGGMQQRVNLARALVVEPEVLLLDEPFASVDSQMRELLQEDLLALLESSRLAGVFVTHQIDEAVLMGDRIVILSRGPGSVVREIIDSPLGHPRTGQERSSAVFVETVRHMWNLVRGEIVEDLAATSGALGKRTFVKPEGRAGQTS